MQELADSGILVIAVLIIAKEIYVKAITIVKETFTFINVVYLGKFLAHVFKRKIACTSTVVRCSLYTV